MDQPVDPVAAVVPLNLAGMIQLNFARVHVGGIHVTVVGHQAGVAGLPAVEALAVLENQLHGAPQMAEGIYGFVIGYACVCTYLDRLGGGREGVKDGILHFLISLDIEITSKYIVLKLSSLTICPCRASQKRVAQCLDIKILVSADSLCRMSRPLNVLLQIDWLLADDDDILPDVYLLKFVDHHRLLQEEGVLANVGKGHPQNCLHFEILISQETEDAFEGALIFDVVVIPAHGVHPHWLVPLAIFYCVQGDPLAFLPKCKEIIKRYSSVYYWVNLA